VFVLALRQGMVVAMADDLKVKQARRHSSRPGESQQTNPEQPAAPLRLAPVHVPIPLAL